MRRIAMLVVPLVLVVGVMIAPSAGASSVADPIPPVIEPAQCPGTPAGFYTTKNYNFNEPAGSTVAHEDNGYAGDDLHVPPQYPGVTFGGGVATFKANGLLTGDFPNTIFNPGSGDFSYCIRWHWLVDANGNRIDPGHNLTQFGHEVGAGEPDHSLIKMQPGFASNHGSVPGTYAIPRTYLSSVKIWHYVVDVRVGDTFCVYLDGKAAPSTNPAGPGCVTRPGIGSIDLTQQTLSVGGKMWRPGLAPVDASDLFYGEVDLVRFGTR